MLNRFDDYPIHQTPEPLAHQASSDRNFYDRTWFNGYSPDGDYFFGLGMAIYPGRRIMDCAFSVIVGGERQHVFMASRRAPLERSEMVVGPMRIEIIEPMRSVRVVIDTNDSGISADLTFSARTAPIQEVRQILWDGSRRFMDTSRFAQFGKWEGIVSSPDGDLTVSADTGWGTKDRSWGIRPVGEPETGGAPVMPNGIAFTWAPLIWDDHVSHAIFFDDNLGMPLVREALISPLYPSMAALDQAQSELQAGDEAPVGLERTRNVDQRISYQPGTRWASGAEIDFVLADGSVRTMTLRPLARFQMKGLGYLHPTWVHGMWQGELATMSESYDLGAIDPLALENVHTQQVVEVSDGEKTGTGVLEHLIIGPYPPAGFTDYFDGAD